MARPPVRLPKGVWFQRKVLCTGEIVRYGYLGRGPGTVPLGREGEPEFHQRLADALLHEPPSNTVKNLVWQYKQSKEFERLQPRSRADYQLQLDKISARFGPLSLRAMAAREIARHIYAWRDTMGASPRRADYAIQVLKVVLSWGVKRGLLDHNRAAGIERLYRHDRSEKTWSDEQIAAFQACAPEPLRRAMILALETGQRQGDLLRMPWSALEGDIVRLRQAKTNARVAIPVSAALRACLAAVPRSDSTIVLTKIDGRPWDAKGNGFRAAWRDACRRAGVTGVTFHDLRGTFVTRRLAAGWTTQEVAMCTGHSLRDLASLEIYADRGAVSEATASRLAMLAARTD